MEGSDLSSSFIHQTHFGDFGMLCSLVTIPRPLIRYEKGLAPITTVDGSTYWPLGRWEGKICAQSGSLNDLI